MKKISNFNEYYSNILKEWYDLSEEDVKDYMDHRKVVAECNAKKKNVALPSFVVTGEGLAGVAIGLIHPLGWVYMGAAIAVTAVGATIGTVSLVKNNPYKECDDSVKDEYKEYDEEYKAKAKRYKKYAKKSK